MRSIRLRRPLVTLALLSIGAVGATACGTETPAQVGSDNRERAERARRVSEAWDGSEAAKAWQEGYFPLDDPIRLPEDAFHNNADKLAYQNRNVELRGKLPDSSAKKGKIRWRAGGALTVSIDSAQTSYEGLAQGKATRAALVITGARLGERTLLTSRGPATVPAWHFTLKGYDTPLVRVAVAGPAKPPKSPIKSLKLPSDVLWPLGGLVSVSKDGRRVTVRAQHGACDDGPVVDVRETAGSVVLSGWIRGRSDGPCTKDLLAKEVTVKLDRPVGERLLLDAYTGGPVPYKN
ncbi:hypothetical protein ABZZ47_08890 [Streptomyces sp. NPDC006465]|uniref:hypothetical protein n=1 Tax=Streptomyces sp. NPDC006465 TaxID=3157174 RepID=UPI0033AC38D7